MSNAWSRAIPNTRALDGLISQRPYLVLCGVFLVSRMFYYAVFGVRFDASLLDFAWQYLDVELLKHDLLRSVFYMHFQPPLFNLFLGLVLKAFPAHYAAAFHVAFFAAGLGLGLSLLALLEGLGCSRRHALWLAAAHSVLPSTVLYEHCLAYSYPLSFLLTLSALCLLRFCERGRPRDAFLFFALLVAMMLTRSLIRVWWIIALAGALLWLLPSRRKLVLKAAALPLAVALLYTLKQLVIFGTPGGSDAWLSQGLAQRTTNHVSLTERAEVRDSIEVGPYFFMDFWRPIRDFRKFLPPIPETGIPALDQELKANGEVNLNHLGYLSQAEGYRRGFLRLLVARPRYYLASFDEAMGYFAPSGEDEWVRRIPARRAMFTFSAIADSLVCGKIQGLKSGLFLLLAFPALLFFGIALLVEQRRERTLPTAVLVTLGYVLASLVLLSLVTQLAASSNFNHYRIVVDPLYVTLLGMLMTYFGAGRATRAPQS